MFDSVQKVLLKAQFDWYCLGVTPNLVLKAWMKLERFSYPISSKISDGLLECFFNRKAACSNRFSWNHLLGELSKCFWNSLLNVDTLILDKKESSFIVSLFNALLSIVWINYWLCPVSLINECTNPIPWLSIRYSMISSNLATKIFCRRETDSLEMSIRLSTNRFMKAS